MPRVSICTSVLNQTELLKGMIENVREQVFKDWELVLVDDGSTEDLRALVDSFNDERIRFYRFPENKGVPHGINFAIEHAQGEFISLLSTDERIEPNKLLWQVGYLDEHKDVDGLWGLPQNGPVGERPEWEQYALKAHNRSKDAWLRTLLNLENVPIGGASLLWRRSVIDSIGVFDPQFFTTSDLELFVRFFKAHKGVVMPYRWAWSVPRDDKPLSQTVTSAQFQEDLGRVRAKHPLKPPKVFSKVTVAIPVRNMAHFINHTLKSVLAQTWQDFEIMVLDDASTDSTVEVVKSFNEPRIKLFQVEENIGANAAQNQMLARCETPFFVVLAADDTLEPTFLEECISQFVQDPWLELVASQTDFIDPEGKDFTAEHPFKNIMKASQKSQEEWKRQLWYGNQYFGAGMYKTQALKDVGGWDSTVGCLGDYDMYLKLLQRENIFVIEKNMTHTRIHGKNQSLLNKDQAKQLPLDYKKIKDRYYPPRLKVILATPFYEMRGFSPYISSMCATIKLLTHLGIDHQFWELAGDSYVDRAKNTIMTKFLEDPDATDLVMIDSDMQWNPEAVVKMLQLPEEIVTGSYPQKNAWGRWTGMPQTKEENGTSHPIGRMLEDGSALLLAEHLAGGFMRIKRSALQRFRDHYVDLRYKDSSADPGVPDRLYTCFSECVMKDGQRWGEDRIFGQRMKALGIESYIYPNIDFGHYGIKGWTGNFDQHMKGNVKKQDANSEKVH